MEEHLDRRAENQEEVSRTPSKTSVEDPATEADRPPEPALQNTYHRVLFSVLVALTQLFSVGGVGIAAFTAREVAQALHTEGPGDMIWFLAAYSLTAGVFVLISGRFGDAIGHRYALLVGWVWTAVWTLVSGFSHSAILFDVSRGLAGLGNAIMIPNAVALLARAYPPGSFWKNTSVALLGWCAPSGFVVGGAVGAGMAERVSWRWGYWLWAILCFVMGIASFIVVPHRVGHRLPHVGFRSFDYIGSLLGVAGLLLFACAWNQANNLGWETTYTYVLLIVGVVCIIAFAVFELYAPQPVLPPGLWARPGFTPVCIALALGWLSFGVFLYYSTEFMLTFRGVSAINAVAEMTPVIVTGGLATLAVALFVDHVAIQYILGLSMIGFFAGNLLLSLTPAHQIYWAMLFPAFCVVTLGPDLSFASATIIISNVVHQDEQAVGGSFVNTVVLYSHGLGMGIAGCVQRYVQQDSSNELLSVHSALWFAVGVDVISFLVVVFFIRDPRHLHDKAQQEKQLQQGGAQDQAKVPQLPPDEQA